MDTKKQFVLCDLNMEHRGVFTPFAVTAAQIARDTGSEVVGWEAISRLFRKRRLLVQTKDLELICGAKAVPMKHIRPGLTWAMLSPANLGLLVRLVFLACVNPEKLATLCHQGFLIGQSATESQRRRTFLLNPSVLPWVDPGVLTGPYPSIKASPSRVLNAFAFALPRFAIRVWINWQFWHHYLGEHKVVASVQGHVDRAEFGPVTHLLQVRGIPIFHVTDRIVRYTQLRSREIEAGRSWLDTLPETERQALRDLIQRDLYESVFKSQPTIRRDTRIYSSSSVAGDELRQIVANLLGTTKGKLLLVLLSASYESLNYAFPGQVFFTYRSWLNAVFQVARETDVPILFKLHPSSTNAEVRELRRFVQKFVQREVKWDIAPVTSGVKDLFHVRDSIVGTSPSSSSTVELSFLGIPTVLMGNSIFGGWNFARPPLNEEDYKNSLRRAIRGFVELPHTDHLDAALLVGSDSNYLPLPSVLSFQSPFLEEPNHFVKSRSISGYIAEEGERPIGVLDLGRTATIQVAWRQLLESYVPPLDCDSAVGIIAGCRPGNAKKLDLYQ